MLEKWDLGTSVSPSLGLEFTYGESDLVKAGILKE